MSGAATGTQDLSATRRGIEEVSDAIALAQRTVRSGDLIDLSGLEQRVDTLCTQIRALSQPNGQSLEPQLLALIDDLTILTEELRQQREQTQVDLAETRTHSTAAAAYRKQQG